MTASKLASKKIGQIRFSKACDYIITQHLSDNGDITDVVPNDEFMSLHIKSLSREVLKDLELAIDDVNQFLFEEVKIPIVPQLTQLAREKAIKKLKRQLNNGKKNGEEKKEIRIKLKKLVEMKVEKKQQNDANDEEPSRGCSFFKNGYTASPASPCWSTTATEGNSRLGKNRRKRERKRLKKAKKVAMNNSKEETEDNCVMKVAETASKKRKANGVWCFEHSHTQEEKEGNSASNKTKRVIIMFTKVINC